MVNKIMKAIWNLLPSGVMLGVGGYLLGLAQAQVIAGWILVIVGVVGLIGGVTNLLK